MEDFKEVNKALKVQSLKRALHPVNPRVIILCVLVPLGPRLA